MQRIPNARWRLPSLLITTALAVVVAGCGGVASTNSGQSSSGCRTVQQVKDAGGWKIVTQVPEFPPYWFADSQNHYEGLDYDMLNEVNRILGIPTTHYTTVPWAGVLPAVQSGKSDFTPEAVGVTDARRKVFAFAYPEGDNSVYIMTRMGSGINSTSDLAGKVVGVETGSLGEAAAQSIQQDLKAKGQSFKELKSYQGQVDVFQDLANRQIDALLTNFAPISHYMTQHPQQYQKVGPASGHIYASWAFRKADMGGKDCIGAKVNSAIAQLRRNGTLGRLQVKWFGQEMQLPDYSTWQS